MPQIRAHRGGQREVLGGRAVISCPGQGEPEAELRVVVAGAGFHDPAEAVGRLSVLPRIELGAAERLQDAARVRFGGRRPLKQLRGGRRAAAAQQVQTTPVKGIYIFLTCPRPTGRARLFAGTGILAA